MKILPHPKILIYTLVCPDNVVTTDLLVLETVSPHLVTGGEEWGEGEEEEVSGGGDRRQLCTQVNTRAIIMV